MNIRNQLVANENRNRNIIGNRNRFLTDLITFLNMYGLSFLNSILINLYTTSTFLHSLLTFLPFLPTCVYLSICLQHFFTTYPVSPWINLFIHLSIYPLTHPLIDLSINSSYLSLLCKSISQHAADKNLKNVKTLA